jgi:hypothetical protein
MDAALRRHDEVLQTAVDGSVGYVFKKWAIPSAWPFRRLKAPSEPQLRHKGPLQQNLGQKERFFGSAWLSTLGSA